MAETSRLISLQDSQVLFSPLGQSSRIKYTCVATSSHYIALGANSGGVYCFHRNGYQYIRILANKEGSISMVRFSRDENCLAVVSGGGHVAFWELNLQEQGVSKRFHVSSLLKDATIKHMVWDGKGSRLFYGDDLGRVAVANIPKLSKKFSSGSIFKKPDEVIFQDKEKQPIVQLDFHREMLLMSTQSRCLLVKLGASREAVQVGKKSRDGPFGARFHERVRGRPPVVYSARPGGRLWEADIEGTVVSTLKLKDFVSIPPSPIIGVGFTPDFSSPTTKLTQPLNLHHLDILAGRYMVTALDDKLFLFDPASYKLAAWSCDLRGVMDLCCEGRQLFVLCEGGRRVAGLSFLPLDSCLMALVEYGQLKQAHMLVETHSSEIAEMLPRKRSLYQPLKTTLEFARTIDGNISENMQVIETALSNLEESLKGVVAMETLREDGIKSEGVENSQLESSWGEAGGDITQESSWGEAGGDITQESSWGGAGGDITQESSWGGAGGDITQESSWGEAGGDITQESSWGGSTRDGRITEDGGMDEGENGLVDVKSSRDITQLESTWGEAGSDIAQEDGGFIVGEGEGESSLVEVDLLSYPEVERREFVRDSNEHGDVLPANEQLLEEVPGGILDDQTTNEIADVASCDLTNGMQEADIDAKDMNDILNLEMPVVFEDTDFDQPIDQTVVIIDQADTVTDQTVTIIDQADTVIDQDVMIIDQSETVTDQAVTIIDQSDTVFDQSDTVTDQTDTVLCGLDDGRDETGLQIPNLSQHSKSRSWGGSPENVIPVTSDSGRNDLNSGQNTSDKPLEQSREETSVLTAYPENTGIEIPNNGPRPRGAETFEPPDPYDQKSGPSSLDSGSTCSQGSLSAAARKLGSSPNFSRSNSLTVWSDRVRKLEPDDGGDDVVAVPVKSSSGGSLKEGGGKPKGRKKGPKKKKSLSPSTSLRRMSNPDTSVPSRFPSSTSIPEEGLPFPEVGLPSTPPSFLSLPTPPKTDSLLPNFNPTAFLSKVKSMGSQKEKSDAFQQQAEKSTAMKEKSSPLLERKTDGERAQKTRKRSKIVNREPENEGSILGKPMPAAFISKVKSIARQGSQNIGIEPEAIQRPMRKMKKMLSSITNPQQSSPPKSHDSVYRNEDYFSQSSETRKTGLEQSQMPTEQAPSLLQYSFVQTFRTSTTNTMHSLEDHDIICSPDRMKRCLTDWLRELEQFRQHLLVTLVSRSKPSNQVDVSQSAEGQVHGFSSTEEELSVGGGLGLTEVGNNKLDVFQTSLYLSLEEGLRGNVTGLITLCVEVDLYSSDGTGGLEGLLLGYGSVVDSQRVRGALVGKVWDTRAACWRILVEKREESASEGDWVVELISDDVDSAVEYISENAPVLSHTLPLYIHKLLQQDSAEAFTHLCVKCYPHIVPWEVAMVCGMDQSNGSIESCDSHHSAVYVQYLNQLLQREEVSDIFQTDPELLLLSLKAVLRRGPSKQLLKTSAGHPISWSHLITWDHSECLEALLGMAVAMETRHREAARLLCVKYSYWLGVVQLSVAMGDVRKALHTLVHLRDVRLFTTQQKWSQLLKKLKDWKLLLEMMKELHLPSTDKTTPRDTLYDDTEHPLPTPRDTLYDDTEPPLPIQDTYDQALREHNEPLAFGGDVQNRGRSSQLLVENCETEKMEWSRTTASLLPSEAEGFELSWLGVFRYMLACLGPSLVSELLSTVDISGVHGGAVERKVHSLLVQLSSIHTQQRALAHSLLEKVDRYLWSPRPTTLSPQLLMTHTLDQQQAQDRPPLVAGSSVHSLSSSLEDSNCHWGVKTGLSNDGYFGVCEVCRISLLKTMSDLQPGVVTFNCGHSFHRNCLPEQACISCFSANFNKH